MRESQRPGADLHPVQDEPGPAGRRGEELRQERRHRGPAGGVWVREGEAGAGVQDP